MVDGIGTKALALVTKLVPTCETYRELEDTVHMVRETSREGGLRSLKAVVRNEIHRRFGYQAEGWEMAITAANIPQAEACFHRLRDAETAQDVHGPLLPDLECQ